MRRKVHFMEGRLVVHLDRRKQAFGAAVACPKRLSSLVFADVTGFSLDQRVDDSVNPRQ
ncbi:MAG: hypothetical protein KDA93_05970 [Planctomycetaceae bacterium]|nr:hypothetical protein [Planctomycetaceae bacterium]